MMSIQAIFELLNWENDEVVQEIGFHLAQKIKDLSVLIMPEARPSVWESCALILSEKTDSELEPYLIPLLGWLKDLNWPGTFRILDRFGRAPKNEPPCLISGPGLQYIMKAFQLLK